MVARGQSDHKPLSHALHRVTDTWSARQQRHLSYVAEFTSDIRHIAGKQNVVADALSRPAAALAPPAGHQVDFQAIARDQKLCAETRELRANPELNVVTIKLGEDDLYCDSKTGVLRPLVPVQQRRKQCTG